mgnify:CR=1 FL=1
MSNKFTSSTQLSAQAEEKPFTIKSLLVIAAVVWVIELVDLFLLGGRLDNLGIHPRSWWGLIGIPLMPFLHGGLEHIISNTFPFIVLGWIMIRAEKTRFLGVSLAIILLGGLGTWIIGRSGSVHVGASGLIYGYFGYIMVRAILERRILWILTGLVVGIFFGGMIFGIIPLQQDVSWEGHLCGMLAGAWIGRCRTVKRKSVKSEYPEIA